MDNYHIRVGDMFICFQKWDDHKLPVMAIQFAEENCMYKVASFNSVERAQWFIECLKERMECKCTE